MTSPRTTEYYCHQRMQHSQSISTSTPQISITHSNACNTLLLFNLTIAHINICSLLNKLRDIHYLLHKHNIDILAVTETWLTAISTNSAIFLPGYDVHRFDRTSKKGGGVCLYIRNKFKYRQLRTIFDIETAAIHLRLDGNPLNIICTYRPPSTPVSFWQQLTNTVDDIAAQTPKSSHTIVLGDFNVNIRDTQHPHHKHLQTFCHTTSRHNNSDIAD